MSKIAYCSMKYAIISASSLLKARRKGNQMIFRPLTMSRLMRMLNGMVLKKIAEDGSKFKSDALKEISRREKRRAR